ncbi:MAG TPA: GAF domain-containing protein, partial [Pyrinomonadaceae bacterium]|nr:GAF domain-containing protein [Pyrinomonadaceae bacterium]
MKHLATPSLKSRFVSVALSLAVALLACALWQTGLLAPLQGLFVLEGPQGNSVAPQEWVVYLMIGAAALSTGFLVEVLGARRAVPYVVGAPALLGAASLLASRLLALDIVFAPAALAALASACAVQAWRLWVVDATLSGSVRRAVSEAASLEGAEAAARLASGLKLLDTVLPLDEAVVFCLDETGAAVPAARVRASTVAGASADPHRNSAWREGVRLCERVIRKGELIVTGAETTSAQTNGNASVNGNAATTSGAFTMGGALTSVAVPLRHEGRAVGALLLRLRGGFDETDRPLLAAVGAQVARDLQREEALRLAEPRESATFLSVRASEHRLERFGVLAGLLAERGFAPHVLAEAADGHAVAHLDGHLAQVNAPMLRAARVAEEDVRALDLFGLLERFRGGVFDDPSIAVRRVLQTGDPYERELPFPDRNET